MHFSFQTLEQEVLWKPFMNPQRNKSIEFGEYLISMTPSGGFKGMIFTQTAVEGFYYWVQGERVFGEFV